jgi:hypothetical protein
LTLPQTHARPSSVLVDEINPGRFKGTPNYYQRSFTRRVASGLELANCHNADAGLIG